MEILCTQTYKDEVLKLKRKNSYSDIEETITDYFDGKKLDDLLTGDRLNGPGGIPPYVKKRLKGKGGYRVYYFVLPKKSKAVIVYIHPKTGSLGTKSISSKLRKKYLEEGIDMLKNKRGYLLAKKKEERIFTYTPL